MLRRDSRRRTRPTPRRAASCPRPPLNGTGDSTRGRDAPTPSGGLHPISRGALGREEDDVAARRERTGRCNDSDACEDIGPGHAGVRRTCLHSFLTTRPSRRSPPPLRECGPRKHQRKPRVPEAKFSPTLTRRLHACPFRLRAVAICRDSGAAFPIWRAALAAIVRPTLLQSLRCSHPRTLP